MQLAFCFAGVVAVGLVLTVALNFTGHPSRVFFKMVASTGFLAIAAVGGALETPYGQLVLAALVGCWFGDLFLAFRDERLFLAGLVSFLLGHVGLIVAFFILGVATPWCIGAFIALVPVAAVVLRWIYPHLPKRMVGPVLAYMLVISTMVLAAAGAFGSGATLLVLLGAALFYVSDIFVARDRFIKSDQVNNVVGIPMYYTAVTLLAFSVHLVT